ncbi:MAG: Crp/Fnr family transcriptional regulator [Bacteroidetes bacterium]|nr:Crp/Fnr family transcriptional regulator [Bacteroidota bacterium]
MLDPALDIVHTFPNLEPLLVTEIQKAGTLRQVEEGEVLVRTGQFMNSTLLVYSGLVKIYREDNEGNEFFMYYLHSGQACALTINCAVRQQSSPVVARAVQATQLIVLPVSEVDQWFSRFKSWNNFVLDNYRERYMELLQTLDHVAFRNMDERLEFYLKRHSENMGTRDLKITHQEIANELNSSREVISRLLKKLADDGKIVLHRYHIEILDL